MAVLADILRFLEDNFRPGEFVDAALNGLQVEGKQEVAHLAVAVDAGLSVVEKCVEAGADLLLVHHGIFWGSPFPIAGPRKLLVQLLLEHDVSLLAIHLPLDAHPCYGNNYLLAQLLGLSEIEPAAADNGNPIGCCGTNAERLDLPTLRGKLVVLEGAGNVLELPFGPTIPKRVCCVSGAGADQLFRFERDRFDTLITGEARQFAYHFCRENKLNAIFAGHYATETLGVRKLGEVLAGLFELKLSFIAEPTNI